MFEALLLLLVANGSPVLAHYFLGPRFASPIDGGRTAPDGLPWLGHSKTFRGIIVAVSLTTLTALILNVSWQTGALFGTFAMLGDLCSSFIKRRAGWASSSKATGLDQIPEALLPLMVCAEPLGLSWQEVVFLLLAFMTLEILLSKLLFRLHIRNRPY